MKNDEIGHKIVESSDLFGHSGDYCNDIATDGNNDMTCDNNNC